MAIFDQKRSQFSGNFWSRMIPLMEKSKDVGERAQEILAMFGEVEVRKDADLRTQVEAYRADLKKRQRVVTFAHSQGNFYSLFAFDSLDETKSGFMDIIAVATPANRALRDRYTTFESDGIITSIPGSLPPNAEKERPGLFDHRFVEDYLQDEQAREAILEDFEIVTGEAPNDGLPEWPVTNSKIFDQSLEKTVKWIRDYFKQPYPLEQYKCLIVYELMYLRKGITEANCHLRDLREVETALDHCGQDLNGNQPRKTACPFFGMYTDMDVEALEFARLNSNCNWRSRSDFLKSGMKLVEIEKAKAFLQEINK